jgi:cbb3-type cytochrome oxidase maturation protein
MSVLIILILVSVMVAAGFLIAFLWSVKTGQMDDDYTPSVRMLFDDELKSTIMKTNVESIKPSSETTKKLNIFKSKFQ